MQIDISSNKEFIENIREKIKENDGHCVSKPEKTPDTKCICKEFKDKIERKEKGKCQCGLYTITKVD